ncbi:MAG: YdcF family protein [Lachnospiraceae bacterium]|nr:YdcF family protein [Lachnospiraceae bacterium]
MTADSINIISDFCGKRDIRELSEECLLEKYGFKQADVMVLFGGSILCGGDVLAGAIKNRIAKKYIIVGGAGHTTQTLRNKMYEEYPQIVTADLSEAEIFNSYLQYRYSVKADHLETESTNCGNNITFMLDLLREHNVDWNSIILSQDATMQYRMEAGLRKYVPGAVIINYATYKATVREVQGRLEYTKKIWGMWDIKRYISLLMGEIPRLRDDENGYGPKGKGFISHVDIPENVLIAFEELKKNHADLIRTANPEFATVKDRGTE